MSTMSTMSSSTVLEPPILEQPLPAPAPPPPPKTRPRLTRAGMKQQIFGAMDWPLSYQECVLLFSRIDCCELDQWVPLSTLQLFVARRVYQTLPMIRYRPRVDLWAGRITWEHDPEEPLYDLANSHYTSFSPFKLRAQYDRVAGKAAGTIGRFYSWLGESEPPRHHAPPTGEVYFGYAPDGRDGLPQFEESPALRLAARHMAGKGPTEPVSVEELREAWNFRAVQIDDMICWPQAFFARDLARTYTERLGEPAPHVTSGVADETRRGLWKFLHGAWVPACQKPARIYVRTDAWTGFPYENPAFHVLRSARLLQDLIDVPTEGDPRRWLRSVTNASIERLTRRLQELPAERIAALREDMRQRLCNRGMETWLDEDLELALIDPRQPLRASNGPLPHVLQLPGDEEGAQPLWTTPGMTFRIDDLDPRAVEMLTGRKIRSPRRRRIFGRPPACVE